MSRTREVVVEIFYFDAGGGHRAAAHALHEAIAAAGYPWRIELVQLQELLQPLDPVYQIVGLPSEQLYNAALRRGWTYGSRPFLRMMQKGISLEAPAFRRRVRGRWEKRQPDMVVSVVPNFNRVLFEALQSAHRGTPYVTIMTDMADVAPNFWMEDQDQYLICGTRKATLQAALTGFYRPERIFEVSGMIIRPDFYSPGEMSPENMRRKLGVEPGRKVALVMFGGNGSWESLLVAERLNRCGVASIVMCGRNEDLLENCRKAGVCGVPHTDRVQDYMRAADFFIGKPGPASISEALLMGLPVIVTSNARTMIQERYNVRWVEEQQVGIGIAGYGELEGAVRFLLDGNRLRDYRQRAARLGNRAIFEIPPLLSGILADHRHHSSDLRGRPAPALAAAVE